MPRYIAVMEQRGEGCDYTIGCGIKVLGAGEHPSIEAAEASIVADLGSYYLDDWSEGSLEQLTIYEVSGSKSVDLASIRAKRDADRAEKVRKDEERAELAMLERLTKKYGAR